jgi:hypothetical protein
MSAYGKLLDELEAVANFADPESFWDTGTNLEEYQNNERLPVIFLLPVTSSGSTIEQSNRLYENFNVVLLFIDRDTPDFNSELSDKILDERFSVVHRFLREAVQRGNIVISTDYTADPIYRDHTLCVTGWRLSFGAFLPDSENICED